jgi:dihydrolipoamide dehydrogenase
LAAADTAGLLAESPFAGATTTPTPETILAQLAHVKAAWNGQQAAMLQAMGVNLIHGVAALATANRIVVNSEDGQPVTTLTGDAVILAAGSVPLFPPTLRPDGKRIIAPRMMSGLKALPASMVVVGGGATGTEMAYLFNRLGLAVTWVVEPKGVLPTFAPAAGELVAEILAKRGVELVRDARAETMETDEDGVTVVMRDGRRVSAAMAFVAIGRTPDLQRLNGAAAGIALNECNHPVIDDFCQTSVPGVYAVGDIVGPPMVANRAMAMGRVAGLHATGAPVAPFNPHAVVAAIYAEPQVAQVGVVAADDGTLQTRRVPFSAALKSHLLAEVDGFVELAYDQSGKVTGGVAVGPHAGDVLAPVALAIQVGANVSDLAAIYAAHPGLAELAFAVAR